MKLKELNSLRAKDLKEINALINKKVSEIRQAEVKNKVSKEKNLKRIKMLRRDVSQIKTILREKEMAEQSADNSKEAESKM